MSKYAQNHTSDVDTPPPAYQESPPFNPNYPIYPQIPTAPQLVTPNTQVRYQTIEMPPHQIPSSERRQLVADHRKFPLAAIFFLFGWFCPPLWVIGACCCAGSRNPYESFWGKANFMMAMVMILTSVIYSIFAMNFYFSF